MVGLREKIYDKSLNSMFESIVRFDIQFATTIFSSKTIIDDIFIIELLLQIFFIFIFLYLYIIDNDEPVSFFLLSTNVSYSYL